VRARPRDTRATLLGKGVEIVVDIDLDRMALGGHVALAHRRLVGVDIRAQLGGGWQRVTTLQIVTDPLTLRLSERHRGAERLQQADEE
jgi:hypothetical protein